MGLIVIVRLYLYRTQDI